MAKLSHFLGMRMAQIKKHDPHFDDYASDEHESSKSVNAFWTKCVKKANWSTLARSAHEEYQDWCGRIGISPVGYATFIADMESLGAKTQRIGDRTRFVGIKIHLPVV